MNDLFADLFAEETEAGTKRRKNYRIKKRRRMTQSQKSKRKRKMNVNDRRKRNKAIKKRRKTDVNFRKNEQDYRRKYNQKNKPKRPKSKKPNRRRASTGYSLPFNLEFLYQGIPAYLMSLSEMFDAVNIYVDGETAIVVDLNQFLDNTEWYDQDDYELFLALIDNSYAVFDEEPNDSWSEYTLDESDPPAKRHIDKSAHMNLGDICNRTDNLALLQMLLAVLRGAHFAHWTSHWQVSGENFYGDHELMERIYTSLIEEIDTLAEKIVGTYGANSVNVVEQAQLMANQLLPLAEAHSMNDPIKRALIIEEGLQVIFKNIYDGLKTQEGLTLGLDDFIMSMANAHETNLYLLRQRCGQSRTVRLAFNKYNAPELIGQLLAVLNNNGLDDTVQELKSMKVPQIVDQAWRERER